tara:strand:+ start:562 stop:699 length:138 start_codon:yes stop_codon:yes gene_type:complete
MKNADKNRMNGMKEIEQVKLLNFRRFPSFHYKANSKRNIFIGDNE